MIVRISHSTKLIPSGKFKVKTEEEETEEDSKDKVTNQKLEDQEVELIEEPKKKPIDFYKNLENWTHLEQSKAINFCCLESL